MKVPRAGLTLPPDLKARPGRADLLRGLASRGEEGLAEIAGLLGYEERPREEPAEPGGEVISDPAPGPDSEAKPFPIPFWSLERVEEIAPVEAEPRPPAEQPPSPPLAPGSLQRLSGPRPTPEPIADDAALQAAFDRMLASRLPSRLLDVDAIVEAVGRGRGLDTLPFLTTPGWNPRLLLLVDRSRRLIPYWDDQDRVVQNLLDQLGDATVRVWGRIERRGGLWYGSKGQGAPFPRVREGESVLALSDLGFLGTDRMRQTWSRWAHSLRPNAAGLAALVPVPGNRWDRPRAALWNAIDWGAPQGAERTARPSPTSLRRRCERLLTLLSVATHIEPGLLRDLCQFLADGADLGTEADVWAHPDLERFSSTGAQLEPQAQLRLREAFRLLPAELKRGAVDVVRRWRAGLPEELWWEEVFALSGDRDLDEILAEDRRRAAAFAARLAATGQSDQPTAYRSGVLAWMRRVGHRLPASYAFQDARYGDDLQKTWKAAWEGFQAAPIPRDLGPETRGQTRDWSLGLSGGDLVFEHRLDEALSSLGTLPGTESVKVGEEMAPATPLSRVTHIPLPKASRLILRTDRAVATLRQLVRPAWADAMGRDRFGLWVRFTVGDSSQRMRWIPPGRFWMGSPEEEPGHSASEGPRHLVQLPRGFWLAETPCTQALWQTVMGDNPSRFVSPDRPVEQVSWEECQEFLAGLDESLKDFDARLPAEAEWEYACRAGTQTGTYAGPLEILGERNAPILDGIAWYGGNSGVDFELETGYDSSGWEEKQHDHTRAGTHPVGQKAPNLWGLYDMLGNVYEWCVDLWCSDYESPREGTDRVGRGGSWIGTARDVRAAYRDHSFPSYRYRNLGFRLARGPSALGPAAEPQEEDAPDAGSRHRRNRRKGPEWAVDSGQDELSPWATFEVEGVRQRMRWVPPGHFLMGSPEDEPGRWEDEGPRRQEVIEHGFWLGETPCTQALWQAVLGETPSRFESPDHPVETVSWEDCQAFLAALDERLGGWGPRLPSEAEWEYACRAGTETATYSGAATAEVLDALAWYKANSVGQTHAVGLKFPNPWGFFDMLGNVHEWCADLWCEDYDSPREGSYRVIRGGSWSGPARIVRAAYRFPDDPSSRSRNLGFRLARGPSALRPAAELQESEGAGRGASPRRRRLRISKEKRS